MTDLASQLPLILPLASEWAEQRSAEIQKLGHRLNSDSIELAKKVGVQNPENIKIMEAASLPFPQNSILKQAAVSTGLLGPDMAGFTLGYSIYIRRGHLSSRLLSHEFRHVHQYEQYGSISAFLSKYLSQIVTFGYQSAPMEVDARNHEIHR